MSMRRLFYPNKNLKPSTITQTDQTCQHLTHTPPHQLTLSTKIDTHTYAKTIGLPSFVVFGTQYCSTILKTLPDYWHHQYPKLVAKFTSSTVSNDLILISIWWELEVTLWLTEIREWMNPWVTVWQNSRKRKNLYPPWNQFWQEIIPMTGSSR